MHNKIISHEEIISKIDAVQVEDLEKAIFYIRWHIDILNKTKD